MKRSGTQIGTLQARRTQQALLKLKATEILYKECSVSNSASDRPTGN